MIRALRMQHTLKRACVFALLLHLLAVMAMAVSPELHDAAHDDADQPTHECAVTLFASGCDDVVGIVVIVEAILKLVETRRVPRRVWIEGVFRVLRVWEHAPPAAA
jgi:hypothetical protein